MPLSSTISPANVRDYFYRNAVNAWNTMDSGHNWRGSGAGGIVTGNTKYQINTNSDGGRILIPSSANSNYHEAVYADGGVFDSQNEVLIKFSLSSTASDFGPMLRRGSNNSFYVCRVSGGNSISIIVKDTNVASPSIVQVATYAYDYLPNTVYWMRFRTDSDARLKARIWKETEVEPTVWQLNTTAYTGSQTPGSGYCGIWWRGSSTDVTARVFAFYGFQNPYENESTPINTYYNDLFSTSVGMGLGEGNQYQWRGSMADDPSSYDLSLAQFSASVAAGDGYATLTINEANRRVWGFHGPENRTDMYAHVTTAGGAVSFPNIGPAVRLTPVMVNNRVEATGYFLRIGPGNASLYLYRNTISGSTLTTTLIANYSTGYSVAERQGVLSMRLQAIGNRLLGKVARGTEEVDWQIDIRDNTFTSGGAGMVVDSTTTATSIVKVDVFWAGDASTVEWTGAASLSADSALSGTGQRVKFFASSLSAQTSAVAQGSNNRFGQAALTSFSDLIANPLLQNAPQLAAADLSASGFFVKADSSKSVSVSSAITAQSGLTAYAGRLITRASNLGSETALETASQVIKNNSVAFSATTSFFAEGDKQKTTNVLLTASTNLALVTSVTTKAQADLEAEGTLFADANDFRIDLNADGSIITNPIAVYSVDVSLDADFSLSVISRVSTTQFAEAALSAEAELVLNAAKQTVVTVILAAESHAVTQTSRVTKASAQLVAGSGLVLNLLDFDGLYDENLRYRTALLHRLGKQLYPNHTSIMLKHTETADSISTSPFVIVEGIYAIGFGNATTVWGQDLSYHPTTVVFVTNLNDVRDQILEFPVELKQEG